MSDRQSRFTVWTETQTTEIVETLEHAAAAGRVQGLDTKMMTAGSKLLEAEEMAARLLENLRRTKKIALATDESMRGDDQARIITREADLEDHPLAIELRI